MRDAESAPPNDPPTLPKPSRRTTKRFFLLCQAACFATLWLAILRAPETVEWLAGPLLLAVVGLFVAYTGTGTLDLRAMAMMMAGGRLPSQPSYRWGGGDDRIG